jgi:hypothetical protein
MRAAEWVTIARGRHADVLVERVVYDAPGAAHFSVHYRVTNKTSSVIGVDLRHYFGIFYPNQWGPSRTPRREVIDERRMPPLRLDDITHAKFLFAFRADLLTRIPAHSAVEYYREFNASSRADVDAQARGFPYVIVTMDGWLDVTDDAEVERVLPPTDDSAREVVLEVPVRWAQVPAGAIIVSEKRTP